MTSRRLPGALLLLILAVGLVACDPGETPSPRPTLRPVATPAASAVTATARPASIAPSARPSLAPTAAPVVTPAPAGTSYAVEKGDTLVAIAARFKITVDALRAANPQVTDPTKLQIGQVLTIPRP